MLHDQAQLNNVLCEFISTQLLQGEEVQVNSNLNELGLESYSLIEIILFLERKFGVFIPEEELLPENFETVAALVKCISRISG